MYYAPLFARLSLRYSRYKNEIENSYLENCCLVERHIQYNRGRAVKITVHSSHKEITLPRGVGIKQEPSEFLKIESEMFY